MTNEAETKLKQAVTSSEEFIIRSPLFTTIRVNGFSPPKHIGMECAGKCARQTTWELYYNREPSVDLYIKAISYKCIECGKEALTVIYREMQYENQMVSAGIASGLSNTPQSPPSQASVLVRVMKVGQFPRPSIAIDKSLERNLGEASAALYKKGLISKNMGYGLAAASYIRRVVEDKTNELIDISATLAESQGWNPR